MSIEEKLKAAEIKTYNTYTDKYDFSTNTIDIDDALTICKEEIAEACRLQREMPEILKFLKYVNEHNRTASGTGDIAQFTLDAEGRCAITWDLSGLRAVVVQFENLDKLYESINL